MSVKNWNTYTSGQIAIKSFIHYHENKVKVRTIQQDGNAHDPFQYSLPDEWNEVMVR